ncbi:MAG: TetR/AcrR family transcriptional regulator [Desulfobacterales bacterium]|nr:TetR/AcrR family transcriptional regulator [Desulfobacterales bacterium]
MGLKERREREKEARKKQILDAARKLLFKKGLQATSINQIARTAELGIGTIYFYYQSKEDIFASLQEEGLEILFRNIEALTKTELYPEDQLRQTAAAYLTFSIEQKDYFDIINYFLSSPQVMFEPDLKSQVDLKGGRIVSLIIGFIESGMAMGRFTAVDARKFALAFWGALYGLIQFRKLEKTVLDGEDHKAVFDYAVEQFIARLMADK